MEPVLVIAEILALLCLSALCIYLIVVLLRVRDIISGVEKDLKEMTTRAVPILENMEYITARVKSITENIDDQVMIVRESIASMKEIANNVVAMERKVQDRIEGPILDSVAFVASIFNGVRTFFDRIRA
ncbi:MAG TPA: DUF948 domain-containing protein [Bacteroidota bacterium]|nr:DUF948 domain-containing protein [Bacteroidota bacterium]